MATNSQLSTTECKTTTTTTNQLSKQPEQEQNYWYGNHMEGYQWGGRGGRMGGKVQSLKSITGRYKTDRGDVKNSIGNGEAKELTCMTHGHELRGGLLKGRGVPGGGGKGGKIGTTVIT